MEKKERKKRAQFAAIWAEDQNHLIGKNGELPWHLPNDLAFFRCMTEGRTLVMGRKTFEGMNKRLLPNRTTIILTGQKDYKAPEGALVFHTVDDILDYTINEPKAVMIAGGTGVFDSFMPYTDMIYRTVIDETFDGDTYAPKVDWDEWEKIAEQPGKMDEKNIYSYHFETFLRKKA